MSINSNIIKELQAFITANPLEKQSKEKESKGLHAKYDKINARIQEIKSQIDKVDLQKIKKPLLARAQRILDSKESPVDKLERIMYLCEDILHTQTIKLQSEKNISENLGNAVMEIAKNPTVDTILSTMKKYKLNKNEYHLFIRAVAAKAPAFVSQNLSKLNIEGPLFLEEIAKDIGTHNPKILRDHIEKFELSPSVSIPLLQKSEEQCYKKALAEVEKDPTKVFEAIEKHNISSDKDKLRLAIQVAEKKPEFLLANEREFHFKNEHNLKVTTAFLEVKAYDKAFQFMRTSIYEPEHFSKIAKFLAKHNFEQLANNWQRSFSISSDSFSLLTDLAKSHPVEALKFFEKFTIGLDHPEQHTLLKILAEKIPNGSDSRPAFDEIVLMIGQAYPRILEELH